jgi:hypothetical protein
MTTVKARKVKPARPAAERPIEWERADPVALAKFDPATKTCTMNCGKHAYDPRSYKELKFMCDDCDCHAAPSESKGTPAMLEPTCAASQLIDALRAHIEAHGDVPVYSDDPDTDMRLPLGLVFRPADAANGWPARLEVKTRYEGRPTGDLLKPSE